MTPRRDVPIHYLRPNHTVWTPPCVVSFDTETEPIPATFPEIQALRVWVAKMTDRRSQGKKILETRSSWGKDRLGFANTLDGWFRGRRTIWAYAHNLAFDLAVTRMHEDLEPLGWRVTDVSIGGRSPWMRLAKGSKVLTVVDSGSWMPTKLEDIGKAVRIVKPPLPNVGSGDVSWVHRCQVDTEILHTAMLELMGWWDDKQLGRWNITGAASGWNAYRHVPSVQRVTIDPDPGKIRADRRAIHGGRRDVGRIGRVPSGEVYELDFRDAYPAVAFSLPLPLRRTARFASLPVDHYRVTSDRWSILADCTINTDVPIVPVKLHGTRWYPTGRFRTTLAGPDIAECARLGVLESIGQGEVHQMGHAMREWADWILRINGGREPGTPDTARMVAKQWGRTVIGKWASRAYDKVPIGVPTQPGWGYEESFDHTAGVRAGVLDFGGTRWLVSASMDTDNAYPAMVAFIESHIRVRLGRVLRALGTGTVVQWDTDGLILTVPHARGGELPQSLSGLVGRHGDGTGLTVLSDLQALCDPIELRVKRSGHTLDLRGPQHYELDGQRRYAGLPKAAKRRSDGRYTVSQWPKLQWQVQHGDPRGYVRPDRVVTFNGPYAHGWIASDGRVFPPHMQINDVGENVIVPPYFSPAPLSTQTLAEVQHPKLARLITLAAKG